MSILLSLEDKVGKKNFPQPFEPVGVLFCIGPFLCCFFQFRKKSIRIY